MSSTSFSTSLLKNGTHHSFFLLVYFFPRIVSPWVFYVSCWLQRSSQVFSPHTLFWGFDHKKVCFLLKKDIVKKVEHKTFVNVNVIRHTVVHAPTALLHVTGPELSLFTYRPQMLSKDCLAIQVSPLSFTNCISEMVYKQICLPW